ncbi:MAG: D-erythronate dehydrogenase [Hyphomicrobiales bacterium]
MHVLITGAAGMLGRKLTDLLVAEGGVSSFTLADIFTPVSPAGFDGDVQLETADISNAHAAAQLIEAKPDVIFHLAAIVSGEAEENFEKGNAINLDGTRNLLEAIRKQSADGSYCPRFVFSSSLAVFGTPLPDLIPDDQRLTPLSSYGTQKAMGELMVADYSRKGFIDGISLRLPTITVRPGKPNKAASGFYSGIIREPLNGDKAVLPVPHTVRHWFQSPRRAVFNLSHAARVKTDELPKSRALSLPGVSATVADMIAALDRVAGVEATSLIEEKPDDAIKNIVMGWPKAFAATCATSMGFQGDASFDEIIQIYLQDDAPSR